MLKTTPLSLLLIFLSFKLLYLFADCSKGQEGENVFESAIYENYIHQLNQFIEHHPLYREKERLEATPFNLDIKVFLEERIKPIQNPVEARHSHENFLKTLRRLLQTESSTAMTPSEKESRAFLQSLVKWLFLEANFFPSMETFFYGYASSDQKDYFNYLLETQKFQRENPRFNGNRDFSSMEDQFLKGNLPSRVIQLKNNKGKTTELIRFGQPLIYNYPFFWWWVSPKTSEEFFYFIKNQPSHLYINLMKRSGVEGPISKHLEGLEAELPTLSLITLDKNSSFYLQSDPFNQSEVKTEKFKELFLNRLLEENGYYYWSHHLKKEEWMKELKEIIEQIDIDYFKSKSDLTKREREDFIELTYLAILDRLTEKFEPASMNITCRQAMDRAPSLMALWIYQKEWMKPSEVAVWLLAPPLLIHNRASHAMRIERFVSAAKRIKERRSTTKKPMDEANK